jgi:hypothetical protein
MVWIMVVLSGALGFGFGLMLRRPRGKTRRLPSPTEELIDQGGASADQDDILAQAGRIRTLL